LVKRVVVNVLGDVALETRQSPIELRERGVK
jgi:hypothetical protein